MKFQQENQPQPQEIIQMDNEETELRQNCWQKGEFINDRSNAISAI